jgi:hypothetical protein
MDLVASIKESKLKISRKLGLWLIDLYKKTNPADSQLKFLLEDFNVIKCTFRMVDLKYDIFRIHFQFESPSTIYTIAFRFNPKHDTEISDASVNKTEKNQAYIDYLNCFSYELQKKFYFNIPISVPDVKFLSLVAYRYYEEFF